MPKVKTIFFDESGYTGSDLLNPDQPFFCVVSSDLDDSIAKEILTSSFPHYRGTEFKFLKIWKKQTNRAGLSIFAKELLRYSENVFGHINDKKFVVLTKIVDLLIEPIITALGYDFYAEGFSRKYANMFHFALTKFEDNNLYQTLVLEYSSFSREPNEDNLNQLQKALGKMLMTCGDELKPFLEKASEGANSFHQYYNFNTFRTSNEIQLTVVLASIQYWRTKSDLDFSIIHDQSRNFFNQIELWEKITSSDVPEKGIPDSHGNLVQYPLRVISTEEGNSEKYWTLQLCDVLAGLLCRIFSPKNTTEEKQLMKEILSEILGKITIDGMCPGDDFIDGPPEISDGPDSVDQFVSIVFRR